MDSGIGAVEFTSFDSRGGGEGGIGVVDREGIGTGRGMREGRRKSKSR